MSRQHEAERLARTIRAYWHARGKAPLVWVDREMAAASATETRFLYGVRSDMLGGWPRTYPTAPMSSLKINPPAKPESASPFAVLAGMGQRLKLIESHGASNRVWREVAGKGAR